MNPQTVLKDKIPPVALHVLSSSTLVQDDSIKLTCGQLDRADYEKVNDVIERIGGKWNGRKKVHLFNFNPKPIFNAILESGLMPEKNPLAFFPTPDTVANDLVGMTNFYSLPENPLVLDPSVGQGALLKALRKKLFEFTSHACELNELNRKTLEGQDVELVGWDFLQYKPEPIYDLIIMNPPFSVEGDKKAWITHFNHAWELLKPDGQLLLIAPVFEFQSDKKTVAFRDMIKQFGRYEEAEAGAFAASGTQIKTCRCHFEKNSLNDSRSPEDWEEPFDGFPSMFVWDFFMFLDNCADAYRELSSNQLALKPKEIFAFVNRWYRAAKHQNALGFNAWREIDVRYSGWVIFTRACEEANIPLVPGESEELFGLSEPASAKTEGQLALEL